MTYRSGRIIITTLIFTITISILLYAKGNGKVGRTLKNDEGCDCHGDMSNTVTVVINGPSELKTSQVADYTVAISGGPLVNAGTNIAVSSGTLVPGTALRLSKGELTHQEPKRPENGTVIFAFKVTAPEKEGEITLYAAGNSSNGDESKKGDVWNHAKNFNIKVVHK